MIKKIILRYLKDENDIKNATYRPPVKLFLKKIVCKIISRKCKLVNKISVYSTKTAIQSNQT